MKVRTFIRNEGGWIMKMLALLIVLGLVFYVSTVSCAPAPGGNVNVDSEATIGLSTIVSYVDRDTGVKCFVYSESISCVAPCER